MTHCPTTLMAPLVLPAHATPPAWSRDGQEPRENPGGGMHGSTWPGSLFAMLSLCQAGGAAVWIVHAHALAPDIRGDMMHSSRRTTPPWMAMAPKVLPREQIRFRTQ